MTPFIVMFKGGGGELSLLWQHPLLPIVTEGGCLTREYPFSNSIYHQDKQQPERIDKYLYVDDLVVYFQFSNMQIIKRRLHGFLDKLVTCANENGLKFSPTNIVWVHFCNKNGLHPEASLKL